MQTPINPFANIFHPRILVAVVVLATILVSIEFLTARAAEAAAFEAQNLNLTPGATTTEININWLSNPSQGSTPHARFINPATGKITHTAEGESERFGRGGQSNKVTVKGLRPGARYNYSVSPNGTDWSQEHDFAVPAAGAFRFAIVADVQVTAGEQASNSVYFSAIPTTAAGWAETVGKITEARVDLIVSLGDQIDDGPEADTAEEYEIFFAPPVLRNIPVAPSMGNHDMRSRLYGHNFNLPNEMDARDPPGTGFEIFARRANFFYLYNNILFVSLNTSAKPPNRAAAEPYVALFGDTLNAAKAMYAGHYDWLVVQHHKSTTGLADHFADHDIAAYVEAGFERLMTAHGVDLVLAGHDHVYSISKPMRQRPEDAFNVPAEDGAGTIYMTLTTASGLKYYDLFTPREEHSDYPILVNGKGSAAASADNPPLSVARYDQNYKPGYTIADVDGATLTLTTYALDGTIVDRVTLMPAFAK